MAGIDEVVSKMLDAVGLRMKMQKTSRMIPGVCEAGDNGTVRMFFNKMGQVLEWLNVEQWTSSTSLKNGVPGGAWTMFKNSGQVTFTLFTESMRCWYFWDKSTKRWSRVENPFYGCKSIEEVLVTCDLIGEC